MTPKKEKEIFDKKLYLTKLHNIIEEALKDEEVIVHSLLNPPEEKLTKGQKISDKVAKFGGSWKFIIWFGVILITWITVNILISSKYQFDPFPFILMNLILSCIAALQAPVIMMSQNRQEDKDRKRSESDYLVNLKSELQLRYLQKKIDMIIEEEMISLSEQLKKIEKVMIKLDKRKSDEKE